MFTTEGGKKTFEYRCPAVRLKILYFLNEVLQPLEF